MMMSGGVGAEDFPSSQSMTPPTPAENNNIVVDIQNRHFIIYYMECINLNSAIDFKRKKKIQQQQQNL